MSEVETSSSRLRRGAKDRHSYVGVSQARPRTSPSQPSRSPGPMGPGGMKNSALFEDDPGIMSEAETSSTRKRGPAHSGGHSSSLGTASLPRGGHLMMQPPHPQHSSMFDDDPGIMSEAETSSTRRKPKPKAVLPVVRTTSKTLERPLGLVFLVYRGETKRALLPNEITVVDTVKALFVRSFGRALTMEYLDSPRVKIYIHDSAKDIFYELENVQEIRDRTILKLFETDGSGRGPSGTDFTQIKWKCLFMMLVVQVWVQQDCLPLLQLLTRLVTSSQLNQTTSPAPSSETRRELRNYQGTSTTSGNTSIDLLKLDFNSRPNESWLWWLCYRNSVISLAQWEKIENYIFHSI